MVVPVTSSIVTLRCLVRCFQSFCGRFVDQEMVLARNFCCRSIFQKTLKQFEPAVSELFEEHLLVRLTSRRTRRVCLGHAICLSEVRLTSRLFTVKTLLFSLKSNMEFISHHRKATLSLAFSSPMDQSFGSIPRSQVQLTRTAVFGAETSIAIETGNLSMRENLFITTTYACATLIRLLVQTGRE